MLSVSNRVLEEIGKRLDMGESQAQPASSGKLSIIKSSENTELEWYGTQKTENSVGSEVSLKGKTVSAEKLWRVSPKSYFPHICII